MPSKPCPCPPTGGRDVFKRFRWKGENRHLIWGLTMNDENVVFLELSDVEEPETLENVEHRHFLLSDTESRKTFPPFTLKNALSAITSAYPSNRFSFDTATEQHLFDGQILTNQILRQIAEKINDVNHFVNFNFSLFVQAVQTVCEKNSFDSIVRFFDGMPEWDGVDRISSFFVDYFNAEASEYVSDVAKKFFVGAVARAYRPGIKFDFCPVLSGPQGIGKTHFLTLLTDEKFVCSINESDDFGSAKTITKIQGKIFVVFEELAFISRKTMSHIKQLITQCDDTTRLPYQPISTTFPRRFIFVGNTNENAFLNDDTGNRRFLPILCKKDAKKSVFRNLDIEKDQIWAQAIHLFKYGYCFHNLPSGLDDVNQRFSVTDDRDEGLFETLEKFLEREVGSKTLFTVSDLIDFVGHSDLSAQKKIRTALENAGWQKTKKRIDGRRNPVWCYVKTPSGTN